MTKDSKAPRLKLRTIGLVIWASGLIPWSAAFAALFLGCAVLVTAFEPNVDGFGNALWFLFQVVTTIGLGDFTATSFVGRTAAVILSVYSIFYIALITGAVVSFCTERMHARRRETVSQFLYKLENLPDLSHDELVELSNQVKRFEKTL